MIHGIEDFPNTGDKSHYVMISRTDPVVGLIQGDEWYGFGIHGDLPTNDPNVTRLETGWLDVDRQYLGYLDDNPGSHSTPFEYNSTAHQNMVEVITGGTAQGYIGDDYRQPYDPNRVDHTGNGRVTVPKGGPYGEEKWPDVPIK